MVQIIMHFKGKSIPVSIPMRVLQWISIEIWFQFWLIIEFSLWLRIINKTALVMQFSASNRINYKLFRCEKEIEAKLLDSD